jgi:hypothetical protein
MTNRPLSGAPDQPSRHGTHGRTQPRTGAAAGRGGWHPRGGRHEPDSPRVDGAVTVGRDHRLDRFMILREADDGYGRIMLEGAAAQLWLRNADAPHIDKVRAAGLDPLYAPSQGPFLVTPLPSAGIRGVFFVVDNAGWIHATTGRHRPSRPDADNPFTNALRALVAEHRPRSSTCRQSTSSPARLSQPSGSARPSPDSSIRSAWGTWSSTSDGTPARLGACGPTSSSARPGSVRTSGDRLAKGRTARRPRGNRGRRTDGNAPAD